MDCSCASGGEYMSLLGILKRENLIVSIYIRKVGEMLSYQ